MFLSRDCHMVRMRYRTRGFWISATPVHQSKEGTSFFMSNIAAILAGKHCQRYTKGFTDCVTENPDTWHLDCENQRLKLQKCLQSNKMVIEIKEKCAPEFSVYEDCINKFPQAMEKCTTEFHNFIRCADRLADNSK